MKIKRISKGDVPPIGKYVLIYASNRPWSDSTDPDNVYWKVAKCVPAQIFGNNKVPYEFKEFGPDSHFGQSIDIWCELPSFEEKKPDRDIREAEINKMYEEIMYSREERIKRLTEILENANYNVTSRFDKKKEMDDEEDS